MAIDLQNEIINCIKECLISDSQVTNVLILECAIYLNDPNYNIIKKRTDRLFRDERNSVLQ